jgi:hypothetical protein
MIQPVQLTQLPKEPFFVRDNRSINSFSEEPVQSSLDTLQMSEENTHKELNASDSNHVPLSYMEIAKVVPIPVPYLQSQINTLLTASNAKWLNANGDWYRVAYNSTELGFVAFNIIFYNTPEGVYVVVVNMRGVQFDIITELETLITTA